MLTSNTILNYVLLLIKSTGKKSFSSLGRVIGITGRAVAKMLFPAAVYSKNMQKIAVGFFKKKQKLIIAIDETVISKVYSEYMQGTGWFWDTLTSRSLKAYKLIIATASDGEFTLPLECEFLFDKNVCNGPIVTREDFVRRIMQSKRIISKQGVDLCFRWSFCEQSLFNFLSRQ